MHRRARHLNPKDAGAVRAWDSRFANGVNNTGLETWVDRCGNANATQSTASARALFITAAYGGSPVLRFDGINDYFLFSEINTSGGITAIGTYKSNNDGIALACGIMPPGGFNCQILRLYQSKSLWYNDTSAFGDTTLYQSSLTASWSDMGVSTVAAFANQPLKSFRNGVSMGDSSANVKTNGSKFNEIGSSYSGTAGQLNGDIGQVIVFTSNISSSSIRKRFEHSAAYSFKFACS